MASGDSHELQASLHIACILGIFNDRVQPAQILDGEDDGRYEFELCQPPSVRLVNRLYRVEHDGENVNDDQEDEKELDHFLYPPAFLCRFERKV